VQIHYRLRGLAAGLAATLAAATAPAAEPDGPAAAPKAAETPVYRPVTSDLMNAFIQPRHIKLWLAGKNGNWDYAEYERHNIGGALARMAAAILVYKDQRTANLIAAFATPQLADLRIAIKAKDAATFRTAYGALTTGCNQCHQTTNHEMVVVRVPDRDPFPDQEFAAPHG